MAKFRAIVPEIWDDDWFPFVSRNLQVFWVFLLTNRYTEPSGLYRLNWRVAGTLLRMSDRVLTQCRDAVAERGHVLFVDDWVLIPRFMAYQPVPNPSIWVRIVSQIENAPKSLLTIWIEHNTNRVHTDCRERVESLLRACCTDVDVDIDVDSDIDIETDSGPLPKPAVSACPYREIVKAWNERATSLGLAAIRGLSDGRKRKLAARWKEWPDGLETFAALLTAIGESAFLRGQGGKEWRATFDWLVKNDENWQKVLEGQYDGKGEEAIPRPPTRFGPYWDDENRRYFQDSNGKREYAET